MQVLDALAQENAAAVEYFVRSAGVYFSDHIALSPLVTKISLLGTDTNVYVGLKLLTEAPGFC